MFCPRCSGKIASGANFCGDCGEPVRLECRSCGNQNPPGKRYCSNCGASLPPRSSKVAIDHTQQVAERRQLTVMFVDLVDSTALSSQLDPEDLRDVIAAYQACITKNVAQFEGLVARYMGDGALVYFGYPQAHEDDAERAVRAALAIIEAVSRLSSTAGPGGTLACRAGIATGPVIVGDVIGYGSSLEPPVLGETPNLAARLQSMAEPGMAVISEATRYLTGALFDYKSLGPAQLKGMPTPVHAWAALAESPISSRFEALRTGNLPLLGRTEEIELLMRRWDQVKSGEGQVVVLTGEAGIGKSRLVAALELKANQAPGAPVRVICSPHHQDSPLYPIIRQFERAADFTRGDPPPAKLEKLTRLLQADATSEPDVATIADLLSIPRAGHELSDTGGPQLEKEKALAAILRHFDKLTRRNTLLALFEDIHWADPTTLDLLELIIKKIDRLPILLVVTTRPEVQLPWVGLPQVTVQTLGGLPRREAASLINTVAAQHVLEKELVDRIITRADGVPLFIEELTKSVLESRLRYPDDQRHSVNVSVSGEDVPMTLQASLMARLDRLGIAKEVAQIGSVIGREFSFELLQQVSEWPQNRLEKAFHEFTHTGLVIAQGRPPHSTYTFKHALVQDAAYSSLLRKRRRSIHLRLAEVLEANEQQPENILPEVIAWHFAEAGAADRSIEYYLKAAERTTGRFALRERVNHLRRALRQIKNLPNVPETLRRELAVQVTLYQVLVDAEGSGSEDVRVAVERARALCLKLDDTTQLIRVQDGLLNYHFSHAQPKMALRYADEMLQVGKRTGNPQALLMARKTAGFANLLLGRFEMACEEMELLLEMYDKERDGPQTGLSTRDSKVGAYTVLGICRTALGYLDSGAAMSLEAVRHADIVNHAVSRIVALRRACVQHIMQRDTQTVLKLSERLLGLATEFQTFKGALDGTVFHCWAQLQARRDPALLHRMHDCIEQFDATKHRAMLPFFMALTAEIRGRHGDPEGAAALLNRAAELAQLTGERWSEAEILRLQACYDARNSDHANSLLQASLATAREQHAKLWELRAAISLASTWLKEGKRTPARNLLAPIYAWFAEGQGAPDLVAARALLDSASSESNAVARD